MKNLSIYIKRILIALTLVFMTSVFGLSVALIKTARAEVTETPEDFFVYGTSVRIANTVSGSGVKFHVVLSLDKYEEIGEKETGIIVLPERLLGNEDLTVDTDLVARGVTTGLWEHAKYDGTDYYEALLFLFNIPNTDFGTDLAVRGYIKNGEDDYEYTEIRRGTSMSQVARIALQEDTTLTYEEKTDIQEVYLNKTITYHYNGTTSQETVDFKETPLNVPEVAETLADGSKFYGWANKNGDLYKNVPSKETNNSKDLYALYRKNIILSSGTAQTLPLGDFDYDSVVSITFGDYNLGTNPSSLVLSDALKADTANHGEQTVTVGLSKNGKNFTLSYPVLFVTATIASKSDFTTYAQPSSTKLTVNGYYLQTANIEAGDYVSAIGWFSGWDKGGFFGIYDGGGYTLNAAGNNTQGLFNVLKGTIKNVTIIERYRSARLLAGIIRNATIEDVIITWANGAAKNDNVGSGYGWLANQGFDNNTLKNVTINDTQGYGSLFGHKFADNNTFENVTINGTYVALGTKEAGSTPVTEITQVEPATYTFEERQDFILNGGWNILDLGDYAEDEILSVTTSTGLTLNGISSRSATEVFANKQKHGEQTFTVVVDHSGVQTTLTVPVTVITDIITNYTDLANAVKYTSTSGAKYGYYILGNDIVKGDSEGLAGSYTWSAAAFSGTLDGRGHSVLTNATNNNHGIFGTITGATVKDVTFISNWFGGGSDQAIIGYTAYNSTIQDVNFILTNGADRSSDFGFIVTREMGGNTWKNINVNVENYSIGGLFQVINHPTKGGDDTFINFVVNVKGLDHFAGTTASPVAAPAGVTISSGEDTLYNVYDFVLDGTGAGTLALQEGYESANIVSIYYGETNLTSSIPSALKTNYAIHGDLNTPEVLDVYLDVGAGVAQKKLTVPVRFITKAISTMDEFDAAVRYYGTNKDGYFILANDVSYLETGFAWDNADATATWDSLARSGFLGTLDGRGHSVTVSIASNSYDSKNVGGYGILGTFVGEIKNLTINATGAQQYSRPLLAWISQGALSNVTFNIYKEAGRDDYSKFGSGAIIGSYSYAGTINNIWTNVTVNSNCNMNFLFPATGSNITFNDCVLNTTGYNYIYGTNTEVDGWTINIVDASVTATLSNQDIILTDDTYSLNLGAYSDITVTSITCGGTNLGTNVNNLSNVGSLATGEQTATVTGNKSGITYTITIPVTVITDTISTMEELDAAVRYYGTNKDGYFILANDVSYLETGFAWDSADANGNYSTTDGFIGTLDGRGHSVTVSVASNSYDAKNVGGFGLLGLFNGEIKNLVINAVGAQQWSRTVLAWVCQGKLTNVTFNIYKDTTRDDYSSFNTGALIGGYSYSVAKNVWTDVTVNSNCNMNFLFPATGSNITFNDCVLNTTGYNYIYGTNTDVSGWTVNTVGRDVEVTDTTLQVIDLGITNGNVNTSLTYRLNLDGLTMNNFASATYNGRTISSNGIDLKVSDFGKTYGEGNLVITYYYGAEEREITVPVILATKVIKNVTDLNSFLTWADAYNGATGDYIYDGYYVLGNDINYNNGTYVPSMVIPKIYWNNDDAVGFRGVFNGLGHKISNMKVVNSNYDTATYGTSDVYRRTAFISFLNKNGVIKNVAFTGAQVGYCAYLAASGKGLVENVYIAFTGAGAPANDWNCAVNVTRDNKGVTLHNCVITYDTVWANERNAILGKVNGSANAYKNVYVIGPSGTNIVGYMNDNTIEQGFYTYPIYDDNIGYYTTVGAFLGEHKNEVSAWDYFTASSTSLSFGGAEMMTGSASGAAFNGNVLISADKTSSDYIIIYEDGNNYALNAAAFIAENIQRATGSITYGVVTSGVSAGVVKEIISGGIRITMTTELPAEITASSAYIIVGAVDGANVPTPGSGTFVVKTVNNTAFIVAEDDYEYITAATMFLEETLGYRALSDDTVYFDNVNGSAITMPALDIEYDSAYNVRNSTNAYRTWKNDQLALNGRNYFSIGPTDSSGKVYAFHNSIYWLDYDTNKNLHPTWFRTFSHNGTSKPEICYSAKGNQDSGNSEYVAMVNYAANRIRNLLIANPEYTNVTFSLMDNDLTGCTCSNCSANRTDAAVKFLNDVVAKIQELDGNTDRDFTIYMLAYYYLIDAPTIDMNEHLGVIYAPSYYGAGALVAKSIYDSSNAAIRAQISDWAAKTHNVGFWLYGTLYHNYMFFMDTYTTMLTWLEYAARTVKAAGGDVDWVYINGQTSQHTATAFENFKQYVFSKAQVEILDKVTASGGSSAYNTQISAYLTELENEFFAKSGNTFSDGGFYGPAAANQAMYNLYTQMKTDYSSIHGTNDYSTSEYIDKMAVSSWTTYNNLETYLASNKTNGYWSYYTKAKINTYMGYITTAQTALASYSGARKDVYAQHVLIESLSPRFMACMAGGSTNSTYGFSGGYGGKSISTMRSEFKADCMALNVIYYGESRSMSDVFTKWGI